MIAKYLAFSLLPYSDHLICLLPTQDGLMVNASGWGSWTSRKNIHDHFGESIVCSLDSWLPPEEQMVVAARRAFA